MFSLPDSTKVNRLIPKSQFYDKGELSYSDKVKFQDQIQQIIWSNKISPTTINISSGEWAEVEIFTIELKLPEVDLGLLRIIDKTIPYPILFIVCFDNLAKLVIAYKEKGSKNDRQINVDRYFQTDWDNAAPAIQFDGLTIDAIYASFIRQVAKETTHLGEGSETNSADIKLEIEELERREKLQKQIAALDRKIRTEPSIGKKQRLAEEKYRLLQELD